MTEFSKKNIKGVEISPVNLREIEKEIKDVSGFKKKIQGSLLKNTSELLEIILGGAIFLKASDIHIEPKKDLVKVRIRIDGILREVIDIDSQIYLSLLSRIKLVSGIKFNITNRPQDGRFSISFKETLIETRTSTLPSEYGESIVLRILDPRNLINIEKFGIRKDLLSICEKEINKPNGMIIVTGPTGSGKSTVLYAFLKKIQKPEIKIITIEDPIEYHLKGISQTQVNPQKGYNFANGLKSIMRQDPDVILVGEIRDSATVNTALQAALTGHLVLTTLHTNDAAGTITRLTALGAELSNIGPAINMVIAQRLVRKICKNCGKVEKPGTQEFQKLKMALGKIPKSVEMSDLDAKTKIPKINEKGCKYCNFTGFQGRIGILEILLVDDKMEKFILENPSIAGLRKMAIKKGMVTMYQDGLIKVLQGITTIKEVERVVGSS